jgi:hypothetical protein
MSGLAERRKRLDAENSELNSILCELIDYFGSRLPKRAIENLYSERTDIKDDSGFPDISITENYALTKGGIIVTTTTGTDEGSRNLEGRCINASKIVKSITKPASFFELCYNLQAIINKHGIEVPKKYKKYL